MKNKQTSNHFEKNKFAFCEYCRKVKKKTAEIFAYIKAIEKNR